MRSFWRTVPLFFSIAVAAALLWGFRAALSPVRGDIPRVEEAPPLGQIGEGPLAILAIGDSLTRGAGDGPGRGFVEDVAAALRKTHPGLSLQNLAIDGLESDGLKEVLSHPNARELVRRAGVILVSIGGNDLSHSVPRDFTGAPGAGIAPARARLERNLEEILEQARAGNAKAKILVLLLYNPFTSTPEAGAVAASVIVDWNSSIQKIALRHGVRTIPTFDLFEERADRLSRDHFHPNDSGYRVIAERILQVLEPDRRREPPNPGS
jgi:lysophospholipase L1-like esterase